MRTKPHALCQNLGALMKPIEVTKFKLDVYMDSDFMGKFGKEHPDNPDNV